MFTDGPVTPRRLETLVELIHDSRTRVMTKEGIDKLLQPKGLPGRTDSSNQARETLSAARELDLVREIDGSIRLSKGLQRRRNVTELVLEVLDKKVIESVSVEPYFATFYSFLLGLNQSGAIDNSAQQWADAFVRVANRGELGANPFNGTKYTGLRRWYRYAGLGWSDSSDVFHCNPYARLSRKLPAIFGDEKTLDGDAFMKSLALVCPELDGGDTFRMVNYNYDPSKRACTLGLSHALVELHLDSVIRLDCPVDTKGWSLALAEPPRDGRTLKSDNMTSVEYLR